jgi:hypothetical protein
MQMRRARLRGHHAALRWRIMDRMERYFIAMAVIGFVGLVASVTWMLLD